MPVNAETAYLFSHAIVRDAAYALQPPGDRALLHGLIIDIAEALFEGNQHQLDALSAELANHALAAQAFRRTANLKALKLLAGKELKYLLRALKHEAAEFHNERAIAFGLRIGNHPEASSLERFNGLMQTGDILLNFDNIHRAREVLEAALKAAVDVGDEGLQARALRAIGITYARLEGPGPAVPWFEKAQRMYERLGDKSGIGMALNALTLVRAGGAPPEESLQGYRRALELLTEGGHANGQAAALNNMGNLLRYLGRHAEAETCFRQAMGLHQAADERHMLGLVSGNLGALLLEMGRREEADAANREALQIARETGSRARLGVALLHQAILAHEAGNYAEADSGFNQALEAASEGGDRFWQGVALLNLASVKEEQGALDDAESTGERAREIFTELGARRELSMVIANLADVARKRGDLARALMLYDEALPMIQASRNRELDGIQRGNRAVTMKALGVSDAEAEYADALRLLSEPGDEKARQKLEERWAEVVRG